MRVIVIKEEGNNLMAVFPDQLNGDKVTCFSTIDGHTEAAIDWVKEQPVGTDWHIAIIIPFLEAYGYEDMTFIDEMELAFPKY